jgi:hypothetical protein
MVVIFCLRHSLARTFSDRLGSDLVMGAFSERLESQVPVRRQIQQPIISQPSQSWISKVCEYAQFNILTGELKSLRMP